MLRALYRVATIKVFVQFSSVAVYGTCISRERSTFDRPRPQSLYGREKLDLERFQSELARHVRAKTFILRLAHVYGPYQWLSRALFELLSMPGQKLPFDGELRSNAVHIGNVCRAVQWLIFADPPAGILNVVDRPHATWRELVDRHARAMRSVSLPAMDREESMRLKRALTRGEATPTWVRFAREVGAWLLSLPSSFVLSSPTAKDVAGRLLAALQSERLEQRLRAAYAVARARRSLGAARSPNTPAWLLSDEVPGPVAEYPGEPLSDEDEERLASWYAGYSDPEMLAANAMPV